MKTFRTVTTIVATLLIIIGVAFAGENSCDGVNIKSMQAQVPIPQAKIVSKTVESGLCQVILKIGPKFVPFYVGKNFVLVGEMFRHGTQVTQAKLEAVKKEAIIKDLPELASVVGATYTPKKSVGKSVYFISDPVCPYCIRAGKQLKRIADETGVTFKLVYANVHGAVGDAKVREAICNKYDFLKYNSEGWKHQPPKNYKCTEANDLWARTRKVEAKLGIELVPAFITQDGDWVSGDNIPALRNAIDKMLTKNLRAKAG